MRRSSELHWKRHVHHGNGNHVTLSASHLLNDKLEAQASSPEGKEATGLSIDAQNLCKDTVCCLPPSRLFATAAREHHAVDLPKLLQQLLARGQVMQGHNASASGLQPLHIRRGNVAHVLWPTDVPLILQCCAWRAQDPYHWPGVHGQLGQRLCKERQKAGAVRGLHLQCFPAQLVLHPATPVRCRHQGRHRGDLKQARNCGPAGT
mmetsp:Transcript_48322/g.105149  ORF Transcript_48322/g.105149 Transcript_48322/m.105149 type:complete len:206 (+) Transcript_48322:651-1268(+)